MVHMAATTETSGGFQMSSTTVPTATKGSIITVDVVADTNIAAGVNDSVVRYNGSGEFVLEVTDEVHTYVENGLNRHLLGHGRIVEGKMKGYFVAFLPSSVIA